MMLGAVGADRILLALFPGGGGDSVVCVCF